MPTRSSTPPPTDNPIMRSSDTPPDFELGRGACGGLVLEEGAPLVSCILPTIAGLTELIGIPAIEEELFK